MDNADFYQKVKDYAFRLLSIRPRSSQELRKKLIAYCLKHKYPPSFADTLVLELIEKKYVNDLEFALWWRQQRELISPKSDRVIKMELKNKGIIDPEIILKVFDKSSNYSGKSEFEKASVIAVKKMRIYKSLESKEARLKLTNSLIRRGFSWDTVSQVIDECLGK